MRRQSYLSPDHTATVRWLVPIVILLTGCAGVEPTTESTSFEPVFFHLDGSGRVSYRVIVEGGPGTLCSWSQDSEFRQNNAHEATGFRAVFQNDHPAFASWNLGTRGDRILYGEHDFTFTDQIAAIAHGSGAVLNGTGRLEVWFSYGAADWTHDSSLTCDGAPQSIRWYAMDGLLWDANTLEGGPFVNRPLGSALLPNAQVTVAKNYGADLHVDGEFVGTLFARDAPGALEITGPSPKQATLGAGVHAELWTGDAGDYSLRWEATYAGTGYTLTGALLDAVEGDPSSIPGYRSSQA